MHDHRQDIFHFSYKMLSAVEVYSSPKKLGNMNYFLLVVSNSGAISHNHAPNYERDINDAWSQRDNRIRNDILRAVNWRHTGWWHESLRDATINLTRIRWSTRKPDCVASRVSLVFLPWNILITTKRIAYQAAVQITLPASATCIYISSKLKIKRTIIIPCRPHRRIPPRLPVTCPFLLYELNNWIIE